MRHSSTRPGPQKVVVVVPSGGSLFEIATPLRVWGRDPSEPDWPNVDVVACSVGSARLPLANTPLALTGLEPLAEHAHDADVLVVPTSPLDGRPAPAPLLEALNAAHSRGARVVGLCLGAFALAEAGLLDGRRAVTHWRYADELARRFPAVTVERDPLYLDLGTVVTSAGSAAALDCCLHLIRRDHGAGAAAIVARSMVTAPHRSGGQVQFAAVPPVAGADEGIGALLAAVAGDLAAVRGVTDLANRAAMSRRSLERLFRERLGVPPGEWLAEQRVHEARRLLEQTELDVEQVARAAGFGSAPALRRRFAATLGVSPTAYRRTFRLA